jgi:hypothetical protein
MDVSCPGGVLGGSSGPSRGPWQALEGRPWRALGALAGPLGWTFGFLVGSANQLVVSSPTTPNQPDWAFGLLVGSWNWVCLAHPQPTNQPDWTFGLLVGSNNRLVFGLLSTCE